MATPSNVYEGLDGRLAEDYVGHPNRQRRTTVGRVAGGVIWWDVQGNQRYTMHTPPAPLTGGLIMRLVVAIFYIIAAPAVVLAMGLVEDEGGIIGLWCLLSFGLCLLLFSCNLCRIRGKRVRPMVFPGPAYVHRNEPLTELPPGAMVKYWVG